MEARSVSVRDGRNLKTVPWGHQRHAIDFLRQVLWKPKPDPTRIIPDGGGAMPAMGMGTGKSLVGVSMVCNLPIDTALITCPLRVVPVWPVQFERHSARTDLRIVALGEDAGSVDNRTRIAKRHAEIAATTGERLVVITNYDAAWREPFRKWALAQNWGLVILDESHRIKQASGKASMFFARLRDRAVYRLCLTGTPMPHSPLDIYAQYRFLRPDIFGRHYTAFKQQIAVLGGYQGKQIVGFRNLEWLEERMSQIMFRVGKEVLDLPPEMHVSYECDLSPGARRVYDSLEREFTAEVHNGTVTVANAMTKLLRLQQLTGGYLPLDGEKDVRPVDDINAKADLLADVLMDIDDREPVVVFCWFHADMDAVHQVGKKLGRETLEVSGRRDEIERWRLAGPAILAVQIASGGEGVDLTRARYSIYYSVGYSLGKYEQSLSRVHRPGQTRPVTHIHLIARNTVDVRVMRALEKRAEVVNSILDEIRGEGRTK